MADCCCQIEWSTELRPRHNWLGTFQQAAHVFGKREIRPRQGNIYDPSALTPNQVASSYLTVLTPMQGWPRVPADPRRNRFFHESVDFM